MKLSKLILVLLIALGCKTPGPVVDPCPTCPTCPTCPPPIIIEKHDTTEIVVTEHDTVTVNVHDTTNVVITKHDTLQQTSYLLRDTTSYENRIVLYPLSGDNYPQMKAALDYQLITPTAKVVLAPGTYTYSITWLAALIQNGVYRQVTPRIEGMFSAFNCPDNFRAILAPTFTDKPAFATQLAKSGYFKNIAIKGLYTFPDQITPLALDTLTDTQWNVGVRTNYITPYCGIAIDPFSDPLSVVGANQYPGLESYYLPGMSRSGTTAFEVDHVSIRNFVVGMIVTPSNQQNGEMIGLTNSAIGSCKIAYATCQAQSKTNYVTNLQVWEHVRTIFDNMNYGVRHGDGAGSPIVNIVNIAGNVYEIFHVSGTFQGSYDHIYGELLTRIGFINYGTGATVDHLEISFSSGDFGRATPPFFLYAVNVKFNNAVIRFYVPGYKNKSRIPLNGVNNEFSGGQVSAPMQIAIYGGSTVSYPRISGTVFYALNGVVNNSNYDVFKCLVTSNIHINPDRSGWFLTAGTPGGQVGDPHQFQQGDLLITEQHVPELNNILSWNYPVGYVDHLSPNADTCYIQSAAAGLVDGSLLVINDFGWKLQ